MAHEPTNHHHLPQVEDARRAGGHMGASTPAGAQGVWALEKMLVWGLERIDPGTWEHGSLVSRGSKSGPLSG